MRGNTHQESIDLYLATSGVVRMLIHPKIPMLVPALMLSFDHALAAAVPPLVCPGLDDEATTMTGVLTDVWGPFH